jgi:hypothetical protein
MLRRVAAWLRLDDYEARKEADTRRIVARFARGNVALQQGHYLTAEELARRSKAAVASFQRIEKALGHH